MEGANLRSFFRVKKVQRKILVWTPPHLWPDLILLSRCCRLSAGCAVVEYRGCESSCRSVIMGGRRDRLDCDVVMVVSSSLSPWVISLKQRMVCQSLVRSVE